MFTIAVINHKGGVGKTTTAVNLAAGISGRRLLIDLDGQASATLSLGLGRADPESGTSGMLLQGREASEVIRNTAINNLDCLQGGLGLSSFDLAMAGEYRREYRLFEALKPVRDKYDLVIIDTPPSMSLLTINALAASDYLIIPTTPSYLAAEGLASLNLAVSRARDGLKIDVSILGILLCQVDRRNRVTGEIIEMIRGHYGDQVFKTEIKINVRLSEAPSFGQSIFKYDPGSTGAECYRQLIKEIQEKLSYAKENRES